MIERNERCTLLKNAPFVARSYAYYGTHRLEDSGYPARPRCVTPPGYSRPRYSQLSACHSHRYSFSFNNRRRRRRCRREAAAVRPPEAAERTDLGTHRLEESGYSTQPSLFHSTQFIPLNPVYSTQPRLFHSTPFIARNRGFRPGGALRVKV